MLILHGTTNPKQPATSPATSLRVDEITPHKPTAKVGAPSVPAPHAPADSLRVADIMPFMPASIPATPALANSPRVADSMPFLPAPTPIKPPVPPAPAPSLRVPHPAPHPDDATIPTDNHTNVGHPLPPTITIPPRTHSQCQPHHSPCLHALHANQHPPCDPMSHTAYHGNAFNPDTSELAEYKHQF